MRTARANGLVWQFDDRTIQHRARPAYYEVTDRGEERDVIIEPVFVQIG